MTVRRLLCTFGPCTSWVSRLIWTKDAVQQLPSVQLISCKLVMAHVRESLGCASGRWNRNRNCACRRNPQKL